MARWVLLFKYSQEVFISAPRKGVTIQLAKKSENFFCNMFKNIFYEYFCLYFYKVSLQRFEKWFVESPIMKVLSVLLDQEETVSIVSFHLNKQRVAENVI